MELILFTHKAGVGVRTSCICPRHFCPCESLIPRQYNKGVSAKEHLKLNVNFKGYYCLKFLW